MRYVRLCGTAVLALAFVLVSWVVALAQDAPKPLTCDEQVSGMVQGLQREKLLPDGPVPPVSEALQLLTDQIHTAATKAEFVKQRADLDLTNVATLVTQLQSLRQAHAVLQKHLDDVRAQQAKTAEKPAEKPKE